MRIKKNILFLIILTIIGALLNFYNLNWGSPFYFHPDERNIASLITTFSLDNPSSLLKGTFAYGTFLALTAFFIQQSTISFFQTLNLTDPFVQAIIILRTQSAVFSLLLLLFIWNCKRFFSKTAVFLTFCFAVFSAGLIQQAHFGTFDLFITFCSFAVFFFTLSFHKHKKFRFFYAALFLVALGTAAKINLLILAAFPFITLFILKTSNKKILLEKIKHLLLGLLLLTLPLLLSPYYITEDFQRGLFYERDLVTGAIPVFYTQAFVGTQPVIFQFVNIYPFLISPLLTVLFIPSFVYLIFKGIKTKNFLYIILISFYLILFLPQAFLFTKWTRYVIPTIPFMYLIISISISDFFVIASEAKQSPLRLPRRLWLLAMTLFISINSVSGISYFITAFVKPDTRTAAAEFAQNTFPPNARILSESFDLGITPFSYPQITLFNFYDLDTNSPDYNSQTLKTALAQSDYIILPSQRLLQIRLRNKESFPQGHAFYEELINGKLGYQKIYETPCDIFCKITYLGDPVLRFEQTASVFDRPMVMIFQKTQNTQ